MRRPHRLLLPLVLGACAGCGLPSGGEAHDVGQAEIPAPPPAVTVTEATSVRATASEKHVSVPARVFFVRDRRLVPVTTIVRAKEADPMVIGADLLDQLVTGPTADLGTGMTSRLTGQTRTALIAVVGHVAVVEPGPPTYVGESRDGLWTAQVVMTLCSLPEVDAVRFAASEGRELQVVLPNGKLVTGDVTPEQVAEVVPGEALPTRSSPAGRTTSAAARTAVTGTATGAPSAS